MTKLMNPLLNNSGFFVLIYDKGEHYKMDKISIICDMYFVLDKTTTDIAKELGISKQYVSKVLNSNEYRDKYEEEKLRRKEANREKRNRNKAKNISEKRKENDFYDVTAEELRRQQESDVKFMSSGRKLSERSMVYSNINAYDVLGDKLVYNEKVGVRTEGLPKQFSLKISIYR